MVEGGITAQISEIIAAEMLSNIDISEDNVYNSKHYID